MLTKNIKSSVVIAIALVIALLLYCFLPYEEPTKKGLALLAFVAILWLTEIGRASCRERVYVLV